MPTMSDIVTGRIGARIRECRLAAGMTQEELAGDIITRNMLSMIESGKSTPSLETLSEICARLGVSVSRIFADEREDAIFRKGKIIDSFRALFREKRYSELADEAERVQVFDEVSPTSLNTRRRTRPRSICATPTATTRATASQR